MRPSLIFFIIVRGQAISGFPEKRKAAARDLAAAFFIAVSSA
jgi:hypothetical protein